MEKKPIARLTVIAVIWALALTGLASLAMHRCL
jgi:hypothetical protein